MVQKKTLVRITLAWVTGFYGPDSYRLVCHVGAVTIPTTQGLHQVDDRGYYETHTAWKPGEMLHFEPDLDKAKATIERAFLTQLRA